MFLDIRILKLYSIKDKSQKKYKLLFKLFGFCKPFRPGYVLNESESVYGDYINCGFGRIFKMMNWILNRELMMIEFKWQGNLSEKHVFRYTSSYMILIFWLFHHNGLNS